MKRIRIILADDHHLVRAGLRALLCAQPDLEVVGETADGLETMPLVERLQPDVLVLDVMMPGLNGLAVARQMARHSPRTRVVMLSMYANTAYVAEAFQHGAIGYVLKDSTAADLVHAVRAAVAGKRFLSPPLSGRELERYERRVKEGRQDRYETLTTREREVLQLVAEGLTNARVARRLSISRRTVETHRANLTKKLGLQSHAALVHYAIARGIVPPEAGPS